MKETAKREAREETGLKVYVNDVAFITEYRSLDYGRYLQVYYCAEIRDRDEFNEDPDNDIEEILFVHKTNLRDYIKFRPWILALEEWVQDRTTKYHCYDLDNDGYYL